MNTYDLPIGPVLSNESVLTPNERYLGACILDQKLRFQSILQRIGAAMPILAIDSLLNQYDQGFNDLMRAVNGIGQGATINVEKQNLESHDIYFLNQSGASYSTSGEFRTWSIQMGRSNLKALIELIKDAPFKKYPFYIMDDKFFYYGIDGNIEYLFPMFNLANPDKYIGYQRGYFRNLNLHPHWVHGITSSCHGFSTPFEGIDQALADIFKHVLNLPYATLPELQKWYVMHPPNMFTIPVCLTADGSEPLSITRDDRTFTLSYDAEASTYLFHWLDDYTFSIKPSIGVVGQLKMLPAAARIDLCELLFLGMEKDQQAASTK